MLSPGTPAAASPARISRPSFSVSRAWSPDPVMRARGIRQLPDLDRCQTSPATNTSTASDARMISARGTPEDFFFRLDMAVGQRTLRRQARPVNVGSGHTGGLPAGATDRRTRTFFALQ